MKRMQKSRKLKHKFSPVNELKIPFLTGWDFFLNELINMHLNRLPQLN
jgi:hypothetical protein